MTRSGRGPGRDLDVEAADLAGSAAVLDSVASSLCGVAPGLRIRPDAGASSDEVATSLGLLAAAVAALAEEVASVAEATRTSAADFTATDHAVRDTMQQRRGVLAQ